MYYNIWYNIISSSSSSMPSILPVLGVTRVSKAAPPSQRRSRKRQQTPKNSEETLRKWQFDFVKITISGSDNNPSKIHIHYVQYRCLLCNDQSLNRRCEWRELKKSAHLRSVWILQYSSILLVWFEQYSTWCSTENACSLLSAQFEPPQNFCSCAPSCCWGARNRTHVTQHQIIL